jgi:hypothetical protein
MGQSADVVLVTVGDEDGANAIRVLSEIGYVGNGEVDSGHVIFREEDSGVNDYDVVFVLQRHHVLSDFPQASQRNDT